MSANRDEATRKLIGEQAALWVCDLREGGDAVRESFYRWLKQSPQHLEGFLLVSSVWKALEDVGPKDEAGIAASVAEARASETMANVLRWSAPDSRIRPARLAMQWTAKKWVGVAAALIASVLAVIVSSTFLRGAPTYMTTTGEQRTLTLPDGSVVYLNAESHASIRYSDRARTVQLLDGEALFIVAPEAARPFVVTAGAATIRAIGTQFNVRRRDDGAKVSVVEGRVEVAAPGREKEHDTDTLDAGEEAQVTARGQIVKSAAPEVAAAIAWKERRLVFRGERLPEVAAEFNRYSQRRLRIEGELARNKRLAGTFNADDPQSLLLFLRRYPDLSVETTPQEFIVRDAPDESHSP